MNKSPAVNRRKFLQTAGIALAGTTLACAGLGYAATIPPTIDTPELSLKGNANMSKKVLIAYATKAGSTAEVAQFIGQTLSGAGFETDVKMVKNANSLEGYDAVIVGSAIRIGNWLSEAKSFLTDNKAGLAARPVAYFSVGLPTEGHDEAAVSKALQAYMEPVVAIHKPADEVLFLGKLDQSKLSFLDKMLIKAMKGQDEDLRDWNVIRTWAESLPAKLSLS